MVVGGMPSKNTSAERPNERAQIHCHFRAPLNHLIIPYSWISSRLSSWIAPSRSRTADFSATGQPGKYEQ